jgi:hypothetical protein
MFDFFSNLTHNLYLKLKLKLFRKNISRDLHVLVTYIRKQRSI